MPVGVTAIDTPGLQWRVRKITLGAEGDEAFWRYALGWA